MEDSTTVPTGAEVSRMTAKCRGLGLLASLAYIALAACASGSSDATTPVMSAGSTASEPVSASLTDTTVAATQAATEPTHAVSAVEVIVSQPSTTPTPEVPFPDHVQTAISCGTTGEFVYAGNLDPQKNAQPIPIGIFSAPYDQLDGMFTVVDVMGIITGMGVRIVNEVTGLREHHLSVVFGRDPSGKAIARDVIFGFSFAAEGQDPRNGLPLFKTSSTSLIVGEGTRDPNMSERESSSLLPFSDEVIERFSSGPGNEGQGNFGRQALFAVVIEAESVEYRRAVTGTGFPDVDLYNGIVADVNSYNVQHGRQLLELLAGEEPSNRPVGGLFVREIMTVDSSRLPSPDC